MVIVLHVVPSDLKGLLVHGLELLPAVIPGCSCSEAEDKPWPPSEEVGHKRPGVFEAVDLIICNGLIILIKRLKLTWRINQASYRFFCTLSAYTLREFCGKRFFSFFFKHIHHKYSLPIWDTDSSHGFSTCTVFRCLF